MRSERPPFKGAGLGRATVRLAGENKGHRPAGDVRLEKRLEGGVVHRMKDITHGEPAA